MAVAPALTLHSHHLLPISPRRPVLDPLTMAILGLPPGAAPKVCLVTAVGRGQLGHQLLGHEGGAGGWSAAPHLINGY